MASRFVLRRARGRARSPLALPAALSLPAPVVSVGCGLPRRLWAVLLLLVIAAESDGANRRWNGQGGNTIFGTSGNWVGGVVPGVLDVAQFGISNNFFLFQYTVSFNNNATNQALHIEDDLVTFDLNTRTYTVTTASGIVIGNEAGSRPGSLTILDGTVSSTTNIDVGAAANRVGTLIVGADGLITGAPTLSVGKLGTGTLTVQSGGDISSTGATTIGVGNGITGTATILGDGTAGSATLLTGTLNVGSTGNGTVNVQLGGLLQNSGPAAIGTGSLFTGTGTGIVNVMNVGSTWNSLGLLEIGDGGSGEVNITLGGKVTGIDNVVGANVNGGGEVNVNGAGSLWDNSGAVTVGGLGSGALNITNQGVVRNTSGLIGSASFSTSTGTVAVNGAGSRWTNSGNLTVGDAGTGVLDITAGGIVQSSFGFVGRDSGGTGIVTVDGSGSLWDSFGSLAVGHEGDGTLNITGGGTVRDIFGLVGSASGGTGAVTVDGTDSLWNNLAQLSVGAGGQGTLSITGGGSVQSNSGTVGAVSAFVGGPGLVTVDGDGSLWETSSTLVIGDAGFGELRIAFGGRVFSSSGGGGDVDIVGSQDGSNGLVTVDGDGSRWESSGTIIVGDEGNGALEITNGGIVQNSRGFISDGSGGTGRVTVDGVGSLWVNTDGLIVGGKGHATLEITGGAVVQGTRGNVGNDFSRIGQVTVSGDGSRWDNSTSLNIGTAGTGMLDITAGGVVTSDSGASVGQLIASTGRVTVAGAGSIWEIGGGLEIGYNSGSEINTGSGTVRIQPGATVNVAEETFVSGGDLLSLEGGTLSASQIQFADGGTADVNFQWSSGTLRVGHFDGNLAVPTGGIFAPENPTGATFILGDYTSAPGATLQIEVGGLSAGGGTDAVIAEDVVLNGNLQLKLINGFVPNAAAEISILVAFGGLVGQFSNVAPGQRLSTSDGLGSFVVNYGLGSAFDDDSIVLSSFLSSAIPGDYNQNGTVDAADYTIWRNHLGQTFTLTNENPAAATPGVVDAEDFAFWKSRFGSTAGGGTLHGVDPSTSSVPEPTNALLLIWGVIVVGSCGVNRGAMAGHAM